MMAMDAVLKELESRIEELVKAYQGAKTAESKLAARIEKKPLYKRASAA
jgi:hypothetical protein